MNPAPSDPRLTALLNWLQDTDYAAFGHCQPASSDASFRRYFRLTHGQDSIILMDAPPAKEDLGPFLQVSRYLAQYGVAVPEILACDTDLGALLLTDFGPHTLLSQLNPEHADGYYRQALDSLRQIQACPHAAQQLPAYSAALLQQEMELFSDWLLPWLYGPLNGQEQTLTQQLHATLLPPLLNQPRCCVHRDYHARNLMLRDTGQLGIIDHQDAVYGPISYDVVSLIRDCYVRWPEQQVQAWSEYQRQQLQDHGLLDTSIDRHTWAEWIDFMGMQRHLKAAGIFARLARRDGKTGYLNDIPNTLHYLVDVGQRHTASRAWAAWLASIMDRLLATLKQAQTA